MAKIDVNELSSFIANCDNGPYLLDLYNHIGERLAVLGFGGGRFTPAPLAGMNADEATLRENQRKALDSIAEKLRPELPTTPPASLLEEPKPEPPKPATLADKFEAVRQALLARQDPKKETPPFSVAESGKMLGPPTMEPLGIIVNPLDPVPDGAEPIKMPDFSSFPEPLADKMRLEWIKKRNAASQAD